MQSEQLAMLEALAPEEKAKVRKQIRRRLSECYRGLGMWITPEARAYLTGYVDEALRALRAVS